MNRPTTIDEYIAEFPEEMRVILEKVRKTIKENAPEATEKISYGMPTFWMVENLIHFAVTKNHLGIYPTPSGVVAFADRLTGYKTSKGTIQFPLDMPIDYNLIAEIIRFRVKETDGKRK